MGHTVPAFKMDVQGKVTDQLSQAKPVLSPVSKFWNLCEGLFLRDLGIR